MRRLQTRAIITATVIALAMGLTLVAPITTAPAAAAPPDAPTGVKARNSDGRAIVTWTAPAANGGSPITGYDVTPYLDGVAQPVRSFDATATARAIRSLKLGSTYTFTVRAVNADGVGPESTPTGPVRVAREPDGAAFVTAVPGDRQITVYWSASPFDGGSPITRYEVGVVWTGEPVPIYSAPPDARSFVIPDLTNGSRYQTYVRAINDVLPGPTVEADRSSVPFGEVPGYHPYPSWSALVGDLYRRLIDGWYTTEEYERWVAALSAGTSHPGHLVAEIRGSARSRTFVDPVVRLYRAYYLRMPDPDGLEYWVDQRLAGRSLVSISAFFARSTEFVTLYGDLTNREFVELIYENILGRPGEPDGVAYWTAEIDSGRRSRGQVMLGFSESAEYRAEVANEVTVAVLYLRLLDRPPMPEERQRDLDALERGQTVAQLGRQIVRWAGPAPA